MSHHVLLPVRSVADRFWEKVDRSGPDDCWEWTGSKDPAGYGRFAMLTRRPERRLISAHRFSYLISVGPIPEGLELDHLCRNRRCVNPAHLEPVIHRENLRRGNSFAGREGRQTHCIHGHPFDEVNTYRDPTTGQRKCRACHARQVRAKRMEAHNPKAVTK